MRKKLFYATSWAMVVLGLPLLGVAIIFDKLGLLALRSMIADNYLAFLGWSMLRLSGSTVHVEDLHNIPSSGPVVFVSNHQGHFDSAVILAYIRKPKAFVASSEASKFPIFSIWFKFAYTTYLEKNNVRQNYTALQGCKEIIALGRSVVIYPEGIISSGPQLGEFKKGAYKLAFETGVPIVPIVIDGTWRVMGEKNDTIKPAAIVVRVLPPVPTSGLSRHEQQELPEQIYQSIKMSLESINTTML